MAEILDIYDENGNRTGRTMERGEPADGDYMLCVHMYIYNSKKEFLIQQRSLNKSSYPGVWDITGGAVLSGEESRDAAKREVLEELGIDIRNADVSMVGRQKRDKNFVDIYFIEVEFDLDKCILQEEEVMAIKTVMVDEIFKMIKSARYRDEEYRSIVENEINKIMLK